MCPKGADEMANSVDPNQTALIWVCNVCSDLFVRNLRIITVLWQVNNHPHTTDKSALMFGQHISYTPSQ